MRFCVSCEDKYNLMRVDLLCVCWFFNSWELLLMTETLLFASADDRNLVIRTLSYVDMASDVVPSSSKNCAAVESLAEVDILREKSSE